MDAELAARLNALEARLVTLEPRPGGVVSEAELVIRLYGLVERCTPRALTVGLKESSLDDRAHAFFGAPKSVLAKLQAGLSKRNWEDLLTAWREGVGQGSPSLYARHLLRHFDQLLEMGELVAESETGSIDEGRPEAGVTSSPAETERHREAARAKLEQAKSAAQAWLHRELPA